MAGILVTIEGGEGAGKTTQARLLGEVLTADGYDVLRTREPGGAPGAEALRKFLLGQDHGLSPRAEAMAHFAARTDHIDSTIKPALAAGRIVLCDRFLDSTTAYQGYGLGHADPSILGFIARLTALIDFMPGLTIILDVSEGDSRARLSARATPADRYESLDAEFHARVAAGFRTIARAEPERCVLIPASGSVEAVHRRILDAVRPRLDRPQAGMSAHG